MPSLNGPPVVDPTPPEPAEPQYGIRWENGDIEAAGFSRTLAEVLGGLALLDGDVALMVSADGGRTWSEVDR